MSPASTSAGFDQLVAVLKALRRGSGLAEQLASNDQTPALANVLGASTVEELRDLIERAAEKVRSTNLGKAAISGIALCNSLALWPRPAEAKQMTLEQRRMRLVPSHFGSLSSVIRFEESGFKLLARELTGKEDGWDALWPEVDDEGFKDKFADDDPRFLLSEVSLELTELQDRMQSLQEKITMILKTLPQK